MAAWRKRGIAFVASGIITIYWTMAHLLRFAQERRLGTDVEPSRVLQAPMEEFPLRL